MTKPKGTLPSTKPVTVPTLRAMKRAGERITMVTAYDATFARLLDESGVDMLLVGDSLGMVVQGLDSTLPVTVDEIVYHCRAVARRNKSAHIVGDMPFMSWQVSPEEALRNAARFLSTGGAHSAPFGAAGGVASFGAVLATKAVKASWLPSGDQAIDPGALARLLSNAVWPVSSHLTYSSGPLPSRLET